MASSNVTRSLAECPKLSGVGDELYNGRGFGLIRGLDINKYSIENRSTIWLGIQRYIAPLRARQDKARNMFSHIVADTRLPTSLTLSLTLLIGTLSGQHCRWVTWSIAASGSGCIITSVETIFNTTVANSSEMTGTLMKDDWPFALPNFQLRPLMYCHNNQLIMNFGRTALMGSASHLRFDDLPSLTAYQAGTPDAIETFAKATPIRSLVAST
ncbi:hypothetical protein CFIMG_007574RA [Ceratocystis fimbriata CBS 114723]|uniref:Uncharacterized protein n=1 Tax=Ceratocystis fimbriata CBS 114723 TaxID=1035309 RepID=A0A2C5X1Y0_9PEZI|nr:hypothetical protein CFIMG_007574RA [Ceratocystis fimbriata CBS 114723]